MQNYGGLQLQMIIFHNLLMGIYQTAYTPLTGKLRNRIEISNELVVQISTIHMLFFTEWNSDVELKSKYGWSMIFFIVIYCSYNMLFIIAFGLKGLYLIACKYSVMAGLDLWWQRKTRKFKKLRKNFDTWRVKKSS